MYLENKVKIQSCICIAIIFSRQTFAETDSPLNSSTKKSYKITDNVKQCSNFLSKFIDNLCNKDLKVVKRDTSILLEKLMPKDLQNHMNKQRLESSESWRRVRRQVADECCESACTVGNIILYCPDDARLVKEDPEIFYDIEV
ncbi:hypothetical protein O0L34_g4587 [Tuta absoluta]|nr:hypothetical protein O0L34_g4587 [Tuta absoluta]